MTSSTDPSFKDTFTPSLTSSQLVIWVVVLLITNMLTRSYAWYIQMLGLFPLCFMVYHIYLAWRSYRFEDEAFISSNLFGETRIPYDQITEVQWKTYSLLEQYLLSYPKRSILLHTVGKNLEILSPEAEVYNRLELKLE